MRVATNLVRKGLSRKLPMGLLAVGILAFLGGTVAAPELLGRLSQDGTLSLPLIARLNALRLVSMMMGVVLVAGSCWRLLSRGMALLGTIGCLMVFSVLAGHVYPNHLLFQPRRLARVVLGEELLLSEYDPRPHLVVPTHEIVQARYPVINIHAHFRRWVQHWSPEELIAFMDACNVRHLVDLDGELGDRLREEFERYARPYPDRFSIFASVGFGETLTDWNAFQTLIQQRLPEAKALGAKGIKIWKTLGLRTRDERNQLIAIDDERLESLWSRAGELRLPILIHVGDPPAFFDSVDHHNERYEELRAHPDWSFHGSQYPSLETLLGQFERVVERHPEVTFILAHLGNRTDDLLAAGAMLDRHPNLSMDLSARVSELGRQPRAAREFFIRYQDRLLFGTDGNPAPEVYREHFRFLETPDEYFNYPFGAMFNFGRWKIYGIELPDEVLKKLYHDNAARLLGLSLLPVPDEGAHE